MNAESTLKRIIVILISVFLILFPLALYKSGLINLKDITGRVGDLAVSAIAIALGTVIATIVIYYSGVGRKKGKREKGELQINEISLRYNENEGTCTLDFGVHNSGGSDVQIRHSIFEVLEVHTIMTMGYQKFSQTYGLDISEYKNKGDVIDCAVSQNIRPSRTDRFGIVLIARNMGVGVFRCWKLKPTLKTNFGDVPSEPIEVWLPYIPEAFSQSFIDEMNKKLES